MLPARDAGATLGAAARSCLEQTFENLELLLLENDATADTIAVMEEIAGSDARARMVRCPPGAGFIAALNRGWQEARGAYLARMDADDVSYPQRIALQVRFLREHPGLAACGTLVRIRRRVPEGPLHAGHLPPLNGFSSYESWINSVRSPRAIAAERFVDSPVANPSAMVRREVFGKIGGYRDVRWAEDYDFWLRAIDAGMQLGKVPETLLDWFDSGTRLTRNDPHYSQQRFLEAKAHFLARLPQVLRHGVAICGAGPIGKRLARFLVREGAHVGAFYEVSARRIGNRIAGIPVLGSDAIPRADGRVLIAAVGVPGGAARVRDLLKPLGYTEGSNFFRVA